MTIVFFTFFVLLTLYAIVLMWLATGFVRTPQYQTQSIESSTLLTIIICARNEEKKIGRCLKTIVQQDYDLSKIQVIVINDASTDSTAFQAESVLKASGINYKIITNSQRKGKKQSITYAMQFAAHDLIILRDADTFTRSYNWLQSISEFYNTSKPDLIIGPVAISDNAGPLWALQAIENNILSLMNCGSAFYNKAFLANGANLIFTKAIFQKTKGYESHIHIPSGDDVLFLEEIKKIPGSSIKYLKNADSIVYTYPCLNFKSLLRQKARWAGKYKVNPNKFNTMLALLILLVNLSWLFSLVYCFLVPQNANSGLFFVVLKLIIDFLLLFLASSFLRNKGLFWSALPVGCIYPVYACTVAIATFFTKPNWK